MKINQVQLSQKTYPERLKQTVKAPLQLYYQGDVFLELCKLPCVGVIGSRKVTPYGRAVTAKIAGELARQGVVIVSGLALGVDAIAHQAALDAGGKTIAVLAGGLDAIYPASHYNLAQKILEQGGALVSEYPVGTESFKDHFIARNRIVSGLSRGVLITEAAEKSGSLHTANFALEQGREVMAVPGNITSPISMGANSLIKAGATVVTSAKDVLAALGLAPVETKQMQLMGNTDAETAILTLLSHGITETEALHHSTQLEPALFHQTMTMLEIDGRIRQTGSSWALA